MASAVSKGKKEAGARSSKGDFVTAKDKAAGVKAQPQLQVSHAVTHW